LDNKKRTDITLSGNNSVVILELKKLNGSTGPTVKQKREYHKQLRGYIEQRVVMEHQRTEQRLVAGFLVVMYDDGQKYIVEKPPEETA
jgi:transcription termination factor Rho